MAKGIWSLASAAMKAAVVLAIAGAFVELLPADIAFFIALMIVAAVLLVSDYIRFRFAAAMAAFRNVAAHLPRPRL